MGLGYQISVGLFSCAGLSVAGPACFAEQESRLAYELEIETGLEIDIPHQGDDAESELTFSGELGIEFEFSDKLVGFAEISFEAGLQKSGDPSERSTELELELLGLSYEAEPISLDIGLIAPRFGIAKDVTPGFFGDELAKEYELPSALGVAAEFELSGGKFSATVFAEEKLRFGSETDLEDFGNFALQYDFVGVNNSYHFGTRFLSKGLEGGNLERGIVFGVTARPEADWLLIGELATFQNWDGLSDRVMFATVGAEVHRNRLTYNAAYSRRWSNGQPEDHLLSVGLDWNIREDTLLSVGYAMEAGYQSKSSKIGISLTHEFEN